MGKMPALTKRALISKANRNIVIVAALASFVIVFCGVASKALFTRAMYQSRVIAAQKNSLKTLENNVKASEGLTGSYKMFFAEPQNIIGGSSTGTGDRDGDNGRIILDALPSKYDYPALLTSVEKMVLSQGLQLKSLTGDDEVLVQDQTASEGGNANYDPVQMPFTLEVNGSYDSVRNFVGSLERSIRPVQLNKLELTGSEGNMKASFDAFTYYQPAKGLAITKETVQ